MVAVSGFVHHEDKEPTIKFTASCCCWVEVHDAKPCLLPGS